MSYFHILAPHVHNPFNYVVSFQLKATYKAHVNDATCHSITTLLDILVLHIFCVMEFSDF